MSHYRYSGHLGDFIGDMYGRVNIETRDAPATLIGDYSIFGRAIVVRNIFIFSRGYFQYNICLKTF